MRSVITSLRATCFAMKVFGTAQKIKRHGSFCRCNDHSMLDGRSLCRGTPRDTTGVRHGQILTGFCWHKHVPGKTSRRYHISNAGAIPSESGDSSVLSDVVALALLFTKHSKGCLTVVSHHVACHCMFAHGEQDKHRGSDASCQLNCHG